MPLIFAILALFIPRVIMVLLWLFTSWFHGVYNTMLWPVLGFLIMPTTTLWYAAVQNWFGGQWSLIPIIGMIVCIALDISPSSYRRPKAKLA